VVALQGGEIKNNECRLGISKWNVTKTMRIHSVQKYGNKVMKDAVVMTIGRMMWMTMNATEV